MPGVVDDRPGGPLSCGVRVADRLIVSVRNDAAPRAAPAMPPRSRLIRTCPVCAQVASWAFHAISSRRFLQLVSAHPPTDEQREQGAEWNPDTFQPALIAACDCDIRLTPEQWAERFDGEEWSLGDRNAIFAAALAPHMASCPPERPGRCFSEGRRKRTRRLRCPRVATGRGCGRACHERRVPD